MFSGSGIIDDALQWQKIFDSLTEVLAKTTRRLCRNKQCYRTRINKDGVFTRYLMGCFGVPYIFGTLVIFLT